MHSLLLAFVAVSALTTAGVYGVVTFVDPPSNCFSGSALRYSNLDCSGLYDAYPRASDVGEDFAAGRVSQFGSFERVMTTVLFEYSDRVAFNTLCYQQRAMQSLSGRIEFIEVFLTDRGVGAIEAAYGDAAVAAGPAAVVRVAVSSNALQCHRLPSNLTSDTVGFRLHMAESADWNAGGSTLVLATAADGESGVAAPAEAVRIPRYAATRVLHRAEVRSIEPAPTSCTATSEWESGTSGCVNLFDGSPAVSDIDTWFSAGLTTEYSTNRKVSATITMQFASPIAFDTLCHQQRKDPFEAGQVGTIDVLDESQPEEASARVVLTQGVGGMFRCYALGREFMGRSTVAVKIVEANYSFFNPGGCTLRFARSAALADGLAPPTAVMDPATPTSDDAPTSGLTFAPRPRMCAQTSVRYADGSVRCENLYDVMPTGVGDVGTAFSGGTGLQYAAFEEMMAGVMFYYDAPVIFNTVCHQQRPASAALSGRVGAIEVFPTDATMGLFTAMRSGPPQASIQLDAGSGSTLVCYRLPTTLKASAVAFRLSMDESSGWNGGGSTLVPAFDAEGAVPFASPAAIHRRAATPMLRRSDIDRIVAAPRRCDAPSFAGGGFECSNAYDVMPRVSDVDTLFDAGDDRQWTGNRQVSATARYFYDAPVSFNALCHQDRPGFPEGQTGVIEVSLDGANGDGALSIKHIVLTPDAANKLRCYALDRNVLASSVTFRVVMANYSHFLNTGGSTLVLAATHGLPSVVPAAAVPPSAPQIQVPSSGAAEAETVESDDSGLGIALIVVGSGLVIALIISLIGCGCVMLGRRRMAAEMAAAHAHPAGGATSDSAVVGVVVESGPTQSSYPHTHDVHPAANVRGDAHHQHFPPSQGYGSAALGYPPTAGGGVLHAPEKSFGDANAPNKA